MDPLADRPSVGDYRGRGAASNPPNRFERLALAPDPDCPDDERPAPGTVFLRDSSRSIIARNDSPDVGFSASVNPYRGCEHGCSYCYARPTHEYLGMSAGLEFESRILVKEDAPGLLRAELASRAWRPQVLAISGVTDCYQPVERKLRITRGCVEALAECRNPLVIVTKNALVSRDADILAELARFEAAAVLLSITTLDAELARRLEPRAAHPQRRLAAIAALAAAGVPVGVSVAPVIPGLNDHEIPAVVAAAAAAGARFAGATMLRLPYAVAPLFSDWLERNYPERKAKVLAQIRAARGGRLNDPNFGSRMRGAGAFADSIRALLALARRKAGLGRFPELSTAHFRRPLGAQMELFVDNYQSDLAPEPGASDIR